MNPKERLINVNKGMPVDRIPFMPTIFEHSANLINKTPSEAAVSEELIEQAQIKAFEIYENDLITVGIDVYNIEAEALGCDIKIHDDTSIPGVLSHPGFEKDNVEFSIEKGRIKTVLNAADNINKKIGSKVNVGVGISGPFSVCVELVGYENLIMDCIMDKDKVHEMLKELLQFQKEYSDEILKRNLGVTIFESWATPPLISPDVYREFVMPYEKELIQYIKDNGAKAAPLIIGGNTTEIVDDIISTGTTLLLADYAVNIKDYVEKAKAKNITVRGNIDPKLVERGPVEEILNQAEKVIEQAGDYKKFVLGTGVLPYNTPTDNVLAIKEYLNAK